MSALDLIYIRELKVDTQIGTYAWEQQIKQQVSLDLELAVDIRKAATSKIISDTVDYAKLAAQVSDFIANGSFVLLETLAEEVAKLVMQEFSVQGLRIRVSKPGALPKAREAGVIITRGEWTF